MGIIVKGSYNIQFGGLTLNRGSGVVVDQDGEPVKQIKLFSWDALPDCKWDDCNAWQLCPYYRNTAKRRPKNCLVIGKYIKNATDVILGNIGEQLTESQMFRIGTGLIPLYRNLARFKLEEACLESTMVEGQHGPKPHPIYKAIGDHIRQIEVLWKSIGLHDMDLSGMPSEVPLGDDDMGYYERLEAEMEGEIPHGNMDKDAKHKLKNREGKKLKLRKSVFTNGERNKKYWDRRRKREKENGQLDGDN